MEKLTYSFAHLADGSILPKPQFLPRLTRKAATSSAIPLRLMAKSRPLANQISANIRPTLAAQPTFLCNPPTGGSPRLKPPVTRLLTATRAMRSADRSPSPAASSRLLETLPLMYSLSPLRDGPMELKLQNSVCRIWVQRIMSALPSPSTLVCSCLAQPGPARTTLARSLFSTSHHRVGRPQARLIFDSPTHPVFRPNFLAQPFQ